jgi:hypothetical protein
LAPSSPTSSRTTTKCDDDHTTKSDDNSSVALLSNGSKDSLAAKDAAANVDATNHIGPKKEKFL